VGLTGTNAPGGGMRMAMEVYSFLLLARYVPNIRKRRT